MARAVLWLHLDGKQSEDRLGVAQRINEHIGERIEASRKQPSARQEPKGAGAKLELALASTSASMTATLWTVDDGRKLPQKLPSLSSLSSL